MQLINKSVEALLKPLYTQENVEDPTVVLHFFYGACDWHITEGSPIDEGGAAAIDENGKNVPYDRDKHADFHFFGLCDLGMGFPELGHVALSELESVHVIERDLHFTPAPLSTFQKKAGCAY